jgi:hypothetical protein
MLHSLQLFDVPIAEGEITCPHICENINELKHALKQTDKTISEAELVDCLLASKRARKTISFTAVFAFWRDGNWACFHDDIYRADPIAPGQLQKGYYASRDESKHFYHIETDTASRLIMRR